MILGLPADDQAGVAKTLDFIEREQLGPYDVFTLQMLPGTAVRQDAAAYGLILTQGHGTIGKHHVSTPTMIRFGEMTEDELFVSADAAAAGVRIENQSESEPLVILKHFGPGNPDAEPLRSARA